AVLRWICGESLGKGTCACVYLAMNAMSDELIVIKQAELPCTTSDGYDLCLESQGLVPMADFRGGIEVGSEILKDIDHPKIVQYLGYEETIDHLRIFLKYALGGSIGCCLHKHGRFNEGVTKLFTSQILNGLEYLHDRGIVHRATDHVLVEMDGICKISSFDSCRTACFATAWHGTLLTQNKRPPPIPGDAQLSPFADDFGTECFTMYVPPLVCYIFSTACFRVASERPKAAELRKHEYLMLSLEWHFNGFT
ncbi:MAP kinase kinase kinase mkh1, partial [Leucoagaricus sp. SymC.cos]